MREIKPGIWASALPRAKDILNLQPKTIVDLTQRARPTVENAARKCAAKYIKIPLPYNGGDYDFAVDTILSAEKPVLFHCFHGRDRTGVVARRIIMQGANNGDVHERI